MTRVKYSDLQELSKLEAIEEPTAEQKSRMSFLVSVIEDAEYEARQIAAEDQDWFEGR